MSCTSSVPGLPDGERFATTRMSCAGAMFQRPTSRRSSRIVMLGMASTDFVALGEGVASAHGGIRRMKDERTEMIIAEGSGRGDSGMARLCEWGAARNVTGMSEKVQVARTSAIAGGTLALCKILAGALSGSLALVSEGIHSTLDFLVTLGDVVQRDARRHTGRPGASLRAREDRESHGVCRVAVVGGDGIVDLPGSVRTSDAPRSGECGAYGGGMVSGGECGVGVTGGGFLAGAGR